MNARAKQKQKTKDKILQEAKELFGEVGISNCSTSTLAEKAQVSHGTIFAHFKTRDDLLVKLILDLFSTIAESIKACTPKNTSLNDVLNKHLNGIKKDESFYTEIIREKHLLPEEARAAILLAQSTIASILIEAIAKSIQEGATKKLEPVFLVNTWFGLLHHYLLERKSYVPRGSFIEARGAETINNFQEMIKQ